MTQTDAEYVPYGRALEFAISVVFVGVILAILHFDKAF